MNCNKCGGECRIAPEQVGVDNANMPVFHRFAYCDNCMTKWDLDMQSNQQEVAPVQKKNSTLSVCACVFAIFTCTLPIAFILALIDLGLKDKTKKHTGSWFAVIWSIIAAIILFASGGREADTPKHVNYNTEETGQPPQSTNTENTNQESISSEKEEVIFLQGETAELNDVQVTLLNWEESEGSGYNRPTEGNKFILAEFEIVNNSEEELAISSLLSFEAYADDYAINLSISAMIEKNGTQQQLDGAIAAGKKIKGVVGYEVPADWKTIEIHFTDSVWRDNKFKFLIEK